jgi:hypothetical protein
MKWRKCMKRNRRIRTGSWWIRFQAYHPSVERIKGLFLTILVVYVALCFVQGVWTYFQLGDLRGQFMDGRDKVTCHRVSWTGNDLMDCDGYYAKIVVKRKEVTAANGCVLIGNWLTDGGVPDPIITYLAGPICVKPFPFGSLIRLEPGSTFD